MRQEQHTALSSGLIDERAERLEILVTSTQPLGGSFTLGRWRVRRAGYGAMQLAGDGVFGPPRDRDEALRVLRAAVAAGVDLLNAYVATMHRNGQSTVELDGDRAAGECHCVAHHLTEAEDGSGR